MLERPWYEQLLDKWLPPLMKGGPSQAFARELATSWQLMQRGGGYSEDAAKEQVRRMQRVFPREWDNPGFYGRALGYLKKLRAMQLQRDSAAETAAEAARRQWDEQRLAR